MTKSLNKQQEEKLIDWVVQNSFSASAEEIVKGILEQIKVFEEINPQLKMYYRSSSKADWKELNHINGKIMPNYKEPNPQPKEIELINKPYIYPEGDYGVKLGEVIDKLNEIINKLNNK